MKLLVGLGNPGTKYARNRHNIGFMALDRIAEQHGLSAWRKRFQGLASDGTIAGERVLLLKPGTYMNESGRAVGEAARFLKIGIADIIVFHDELDLQPGKLRIKVGGGNAGHNGLRSITAHLDNAYTRVRIGIGHPGRKDKVASYVLHDFAKADQDWIDPLLATIADELPSLLTGRQDRFQTAIGQAMADSDTGRPVATSDRGQRGEPEDGANRPKRPSQRDLALKAAETAASRPRAPTRHPAGERQAKSQTAMADRLKAWLDRRKDGDA